MMKIIIMIIFVVVVVVVDHDDDKKKDKGANVGWAKIFVVFIVKSNYLWFIINKNE